MTKYSDGFVSDRNTKLAYTSQDPELVKSTHVDEDQKLLQEATGGMFGYCEICSGFNLVSQMDILYEDKDDEGKIQYICITCKMGKSNNDS